MTYGLRVFLEDTDAGGIVYHAQFLCFMERARTLYFYHKGIDHSQLIAEKSGNFVVKNINMNFMKPGRLGDELVVETFVKNVNGASVDCYQVVKRKENTTSASANLTTLVDANLTLAFVSPHTGFPKRLPKEIIARIV